MELNKNIYTTLKNTDSDNSQNQRLRDIEWYNYNNNVKKIKIRLLELEKIKKLKVSVSNEPIIEITSEIEDNNNMSSSNTSNIKMIEKQNEEKIQNNINNNNINKKIIDDIFNNAEVESIKDNKKSNIDNKNNNILENQNILKNQNILNNKSDKKKEKKEVQDNSEPEGEIKVLPSQVKNPLEWLFTENYCFNSQSMDDFGYMLTAYVVGNIFGSWFGLFLVSTGLFPTIGMAIAIYAVIPKGLIIGISKFFSRMLGMDLPLSNDYKNLTTCVVKYAQNAPKKVQEKVKLKETRLKFERQREKEIKQMIKQHREKLQKYIDNVLPEIDKKDNIKPNLIRLKDNKKEEQKQSIVKNSNKSIKTNLNNIEDVNKLIDMIKQEKEKNKNKEKELWLNKIDNQVKSDISRSLLLEKPQNNN